MGDLWHGPVTRWLPGLRYLEGTDHKEDVAPALNGTDGARRVRSSVTHSVDVVEQRRGSRRAKEEIGLESAYIEYHNEYFFWEGKIRTCRDCSISEPGLRLCSTPNGHVRGG